MPRFLDVDYYAMAISDHAAIINKANFMIPQSLPKLTVNPKDCFSNDLLLDLDSYDLRDTGEFCTTSSVQDLANIIFGSPIPRLEVLEAYQGDTKIRCIGKELLEVIPSSNPNSDCSFESDSSWEQIKSVCHSSAFPSLETFALEQLDSDVRRQLDVPLNISDLELAVRNLPSLNLLVTRLQVVQIEDPLSKIDGSVWQESDFFCDDFTIIPLHLEEIADPAKEHFQKQASQVIRENCWEPFLSPPVPPDKAFQTLESIHDLEFVKTLTSFNSAERDDQHFVEDTDSFAKLTGHTKNFLSNVDKFSEEDLPSLRERDPMPFLKFNDIVFSPESHSHQDTVRQERDSTLLEFLPIEVPILYGSEEPHKQIIQFSIQSLDLKAELQVQVKRPLIKRREMRVLERQAWEKAKHYDEMCLPEPSLQEECMPDVIKEVLSCLDLHLDNFDIDELAHQWSFDAPTTPASVLNVAVLASDVHLLKPEPVDDFTKFSPVEMDFVSKGFKMNGGSPFQQVPTPVKMPDACSKEIRKPEPKPPLTKIMVPSLNPLDSFIQVRSQTADLSNSNTKGNEPPGEAKPAQSVITPMSVAPVSGARAFVSVRTIEVPFTNPFAEVLQFILDSASCHMHSLKQEGLLGMQQAFMEVSTDTTEFLLKEREKQSSDVQLSCSNSPNTSEHVGIIMQSIVTMHLLRAAADLLLNACLESCVSHLTSQINNQMSTLGDSFSDVCKQLFQFQSRFLQEGVLHPKLNVLSREIGRVVSQHCHTKILILVQKGLHSLTNAIKNILSTIPDLTIKVADNIQSIDMGCISGTTAFIAPHFDSMTLNQISKFSLVVQYDENLHPSLQNFCKENDISYIGLVTMFLSEDSCRDSAVVSCKTSPITIICSTEVTQYKQLLYALESRHNILVIERDYSEASSHESDLCFADFIISCTHCVVLQPLQNMKGDWNLETSVKRILALGLQFTHCYIILHGIGASNRYLLEKEMLCLLYKFTAALCNLKRSSKDFDALFKVLISLTEEDVAVSIKTIVDCYTSSKAEPDLLRSWLSTELSQNEKWLLQIPCLNSMSAQLLLTKYSPEQILDSPDTLKLKIPEIPHKVFVYLQYITAEWKHEQYNSVSSSQASASTSLISNRSFGSSSHPTFSSPSYSPVLEGDNGSDMHQSHPWVTQADDTDVQQHLPLKAQSPDSPLNVERMQSSHHDTSTSMKNSSVNDTDSRKQVNADESRYTARNQNVMDNAHHRHVFEPHDLHTSEQFHEHTQTGSRAEISINENFLLKPISDPNRQHEVQSIDNVKHQEFDLNRSASFQRHPKLQRHSANRNLDHLTDNAQNSCQVSDMVCDNSADPLFVDCVRRSEQELFRNNRGNNKSYGGYPSMKMASSDQRCSKGKPTQENYHNSNMSQDQVHIEHNPASQRCPLRFSCKIGQDDMYFDYENCLPTKRRCLRSDNFSVDTIEHACHNSFVQLSPVQYQRTDTKSYSDSLPYMSDCHMITSGKSIFSCLNDNRRFERNTEESDSSMIWSSSREAPTVRKECTETDAGKDDVHFQEASHLFPSVKTEIQDPYEYGFQRNKTAGCLSTDTLHSLQTSSVSSYYNEEKLQREQRKRLGGGHFDSYDYMADNSLRDSVIAQHKCFEGDMYSSSAEPAFNPVSSKSSSSFGIFSTKAIRHNDCCVCPQDINGTLPQTSDINCTVASDSLQDRTPTTMFSNVGSSFADIVTDRTTSSCDSLPFSVSRALRRHLKHLENSRCKTPTGFSILQDGNNSSVRVSRPSKCGSVTDENLELNYHKGGKAFNSGRKALSSLENIFCRDIREGGSFTSDSSEQDAMNPIGHLNTLEQPTQILHRQQHQIGGFKDGLIPGERDTIMKRHKMHTDHLVNVDHARAYIYNNTGNTAALPVSTVKSSDGHVSQHGAFVYTDPGATAVQSARKNSMPYTPRRGITVGLAQPLRRHDIVKEHRETHTTEVNNSESSELQHGSNITSPQEGNIQDFQTSVNASPPMDLTSDETDRHQRINEATETSEQFAHEAKMRKWNTHLSYFASENQHRSQSHRDEPSTFESSEQTRASSTRQLTDNRRRTLQLERRPDNCGQTVLVFK